MTKSFTRTTLLSVTLALIGFSVALATADNVAEGRANLGNAGERSLVGSLVISNPIRMGPTVGSQPGAQFFDLGDASLGSQLVRYITAYGGLRPYVVTSTTTGNSGLIVQKHGIVTGLTAPASPLPFFFNATVTDSDGVARIGSFRINDATVGQFRFAHDALSSGIVGEDYITNIELIGATLGNPSNTSTPTSISTATLSIVSGSIRFNGASINSLESLGLTIYNDGTIAGRPLKNGIITFTLRATKVGTGVLANNRSNTSPDQPLSIDVKAMSQIPGGSVQTELVTAATNLRINFSKPGRDILGFNCFYNPNGLSSSDFAGKVFIIRFAGRTFSTTLDGAGQARTGNVTVKNSAPSGLLKIKVKAQNFSTLFAPVQLPDKTSIIIPVQIQLGDTFLGVEPVQYFISNRRGKASLKYVIGRQRQPGGMFQLLQVAAKESSSGTSFKTKFLINQMADTSAEVFGDASTIQVCIGKNFIQTLPLSRNKGRYGPPGVASVNINPKSKLGTIFTYPLTEAQTGIKTASTGGGATQNFNLGVEIKTNTQTFKGKASRKIFPFGTR